MGPLSHAHGGESGPERGEPPRWQGPSTMAGTAMGVSLQVSSEDRQDWPEPGLRRRRPGLGLPLCSHTYHRTWLVQARRSRLALLALHTFSAWDASLPLHKEGNEGMAMAAGPRTPFPPLRGMGLQLAAPPVLLPPHPSQPPPALAPLLLPPPSLHLLPTFSPRSLRSPFSPRGPGNPWQKE